MKYIKKFNENLKSEKDKLLLREIGEISYILEDENYVVDYGIVYDQNSHSMEYDATSLLGDKKILWIRISFRRSEEDYSIDVAKTWKRRGENLKNSDEFEEYENRLSEILKKFKLDYRDVLKHQGNKRSGLPYVLMNFNIL